MTVIPSCRSVDIRKPQYTTWRRIQRMMAKFLSIVNGNFCRFYINVTRLAPKPTSMIQRMSKWLPSQIVVSTITPYDIDDFYFIFILSYYGCMFVSSYISINLSTLWNRFLKKNGFTSQYSLINVISVCIVSTLFKTMSPFHIGCAPLYVSLSIYVCILFSLSFYFAGTCIIYISTVIQIQIT